MGDLSLENQARILRCAEDGSFRLLGAKGEVRVDVRIIAATNRSLRDAVAEGRFRQDLYHRLAGFEISIPPLREHASDIPVLAQYLFEQNRHLAMVSLKGFTPEALQALNEHTWPGNVRELRLCVQRAVTVAREPRWASKTCGCIHRPCLRGLPPYRLCRLLRPKNGISPKSAPKMRGRIDVL